MKNPFSNVADSVTGLLNVGNDIVDTLFTSTKEKKAAKRKLVKALQDGDLQRAQMEIKRLKTNADDRANAREMYRKTRSWIVPFLAVAFTLGFFFVIAYVLAYGVPDGQSQVTWILVGTLQTATITILTFFFGRTDREDQQAANMPLDGPQTPTRRQRDGGGLDPSQVGASILEDLEIPQAPLAEIDSTDE